MFTSLWTKCNVLVACIRLIEKEEIFFLSIEQDVFFLSIEQFHHQQRLILHENPLFGWPYKVLIGIYLHWLSILSMGYLQIIEWFQNVVKVVWSVWLQKCLIFNCPPFFFPHWPLHFSNLNQHFKSSLWLSTTRLEVQILRPSWSPPLLELSSAHCCYN